MAKKKATKKKATKKKATKKKATKRAVKAKKPKMLKKGGRAAKRSNEQYRRSLVRAANKDVNARFRSLGFDSDDLRSSTDAS